METVAAPGKHGAVRGHLGFRQQPLVEVLLRWRDFFVFFSLSIHILLLMLLLQILLLARPVVDEFLRRFDALFNEGCVPAWSYTRVSIVCYLI